MATWQDYYDGRKRAKIKPEQIKARSMLKNKKRVAQVMQGAFNFYYCSYKAIDKISSTGEISIRQACDLRIALRSDLRKAADAWFGHDLKSCFKHLAANNNEWRDDTWDGFGGHCNVPRGIANFYKEIKKRRNSANKSLASISSYREWKRYQLKLKRLKDNEKWDKLGKEIGYTEKVFNEVTPYAWALLGGCERGTEMSKLMGKWIGYGGKVHKYMTLYAKIADGQNVQQSLCIEIAAAVVDTVPVFGPLYADVIRGIPNLVKFFERHAQTTNRAINRV